MALVSHRASRLFVWWNTYKFLELWPIIEKQQYGWEMVIAIVNPCSKFGFFGSRSAKYCQPSDIVRRASLCTWLWNALEMFNSLLDQSRLNLSQRHGPGSSLRDKPFTVHSFQWLQAPTSEDAVLRCSRDWQNIRTWWCSDGIAENLAAFLPCLPNI